MNSAIEALKSYPRIKIIEAYTNKHLKYTSKFEIKDISKIAEIRFRAGEMPEVYYETAESLEMVKNLKNEPVKENNDPRLPYNNIQSCSDI